MPYGITGGLILSKQAASSGFTIPNTTAIESASSATPMKLLSEGITVSYDRFDMINIHGTIAEPDDEVGVFRVQGPTVFPAHSENISYILGGCFITSGTTTLSGYLHTNVFTQSNSDWSSTLGGCALPAYTMEMFRGHSSNWRYTGMTINRLEFSFAPNQDVRVSADWLGYTSSLITPTSLNYATYEVLSSGYFKYSPTSLSIGGTATGACEALSITIDNQLEGIPSLNGEDRIYRIVRRGPQLINIRGTRTFENTTEYTNFINQTEQRLVATVTRASSYMLSFDIPRMVYTAYPITMGGRERILVNFEGKARYHQGSGAAIKVTATSVRSTWSPAGTGF